MTAKEYKEYKGLHKESLRDNMDNIEVSLTDISEEVTKKISKEKYPSRIKRKHKNRSCRWTSCQKYKR